MCVARTRENLQFLSATFGSKSDEFIMQEQIVCIVLFTHNNNSLTKLSKFFYLNIQVHKNKKNTKQNHSVKQNF